MRVYVVESGLYSDRGISGVFATPERAMAEWPGDKWEPCTYAEPGMEWANEKDWDEHRVISCFEVQE